MITVGSLYSGVGGIDLGFQQEGFSISWSNEWDKNACITFRHNFDHKLIEKDIWDLDFTKLSKIDVLTAGFPCQSFSVAGYRKGFKEKRGQLSSDNVCRLGEAIFRNILDSNILNDKKRIVE